MEQLLANSVNLLGFCAYMAAVIAAITLPIWGYKLFEKKVLNRHEALEITRMGGSAEKQSMSIVASIGTTTAGVFLIQVMPLAFDMIKEVGGSYAVDVVYGQHLPGGALGGAIGDFMGLTTQLSDVLQNAAPIAAVGLGGYNLLNNLSRGLPAISLAKFFNK